MVAKSFARIHAANLINAGILPLTFPDPADFDKLSEDDKLTLEGVFDGMASGKLILTDETAGVRIPLTCSFTQRQQSILRAGGLLAYTKDGENKN